MAYFLSLSSPFLCPPHLPLLCSSPPSPKLSLFSATKTRSSASPPSCCSKPDVVVTREQGKNAKLTNALAKYNINCLEVPLVKHTQGPDMNKFSYLLQASELQATFTLKIFRFEIISRAAGAPKVRVGVVGAGTASVFHEIVESAGQTLEVAFTPSKATGKALASELPKYGGTTCKVLYPASVKAGNEIEEGLSDRGFDVTRLNTYNTIPVQELDQDILKQALSAPVLAVASPSAIRAWVNLLPKSESWDKCVACIGQTTALAAKNLGLKNVYYPDNPGIDGWVGSILDALRIHGEIQKIFLPITKA